LHNFDAIYSVKGNSLTSNQRYKLTIAYRGTRYHGWQAQAVPDTWTGERPDEGQGIATIQETLARAIGSVVGHPADLIGSSRTDAGVHAKGQVAHFDTHMTQIPPDGLRRAVNARLPEDIVIRKLEPALPTFDAIAQTVSKRYQYSIRLAKDRDVFAPDLAWHRWQDLDVETMARAAGRFVGTYDFASFARPGHGRLNTVRTVLGCDVVARGPRLVIGVTGTGFLWHMVRIMVGTLVEVGLGRYGPDEVTKMIEAKDRQAAGPTAPAHGLYLQWIKYRAMATDESPNPTRRSNSTIG
jgi:tRNA pseudouridine38-40 synthase